MKKYRILVLVLLTMLLTFVAALPIGATNPPPASTATGVVSCAGVDFTGTVAAGEQVKLITRLYPDENFVNPVQVSTQIITAEGPFSEFIPWNEYPYPRRAYDADMFASVDGGVTWTALGFLDGWLDCPPPPPPPGGEGCTPGYWKNHLDSWMTYAPSDDYDTVFGVTSTFGPIDLDGAVNMGGGKEKALARHAVAALLNATNSGVSFAYTPVQVIQYVQDAYSSGEYNLYKDMLEMENGDLTLCPLN